MLLRAHTQQLINDVPENIVLDEWILKEDLKQRIKLFVEFKSVNVHGNTVTSRFRHFIVGSGLFEKITEDHYIANILFPFRDQERLITFSANLSRSNPTLDLSLFYNNKSLLTISINYKDEMLVTRESLRKTKFQWSNQDIYEIFEAINQYLKADNIIFSVGLEKIKENNLHALIVGDFTNASFNQLVNQYKKSSLSYRINHVLLSNANCINNKYRFNFDWTDSNNTVHPLWGEFSLNDRFFDPKGSESGYSWVFTEKSLLENFAPYNSFHLKTGQHYYSLKLFEPQPQAEKYINRDIKILDIWFTMDGLFGELNKIHKGKRLTGNDVLGIYLLFDNLFKIKNTFINDVSAIENADRSLTIPLRLILALATGKTWYQSKLPGVTLFNCHRFNSSANGEVTQDEFERNRALHELQTFPLYKWYELLPGDDKYKLCDLYNRNINQVFNPAFSDMKFKTRSSANLTNLFDKKVTIKMLTEIIYDNSKRQKCITYDLNMLTYLLVGVPGDLEIVTDMNGSDAWVKTRANQLLFGSTFWVKRSENTLNMFK